MIIILLYSKMGISNYIKIGNILSQKETILKHKDTSFNGRGTEKEFKLLSDNFENSHIFEIDDNIKKLLCLTNSPKDNKDIKLPFNNIFLDFELTKDELSDLGVKSNYNKVFGLFAYETEVEEDNIKFRKTEIGFCVDDGDSIGFDFNLIHYDSNEKIKFRVEKCAYKCKETSVFMEKMFLNFLNFLNNPEIKLIENKRSDKNIERRKRNGDVPIGVSSKIILYGELKKYVDEFDSSSFSCSYRFWVRGHFHKYHTKTGLIVKWILPYLKGEGIVVMKRYKLKKEEKK